MAAADASTSNEEVIKLRPVVNNKFCSNSRSTFTVRKMPPVSYNVGVIVIEDSEGCKKFIVEELALKESDGNLILTVEPKDMMLNLTGQKQWKAFPKSDLEPLFTLKYSGPKNSIKVSLTNSKRCDYEIEEGSFEKPIFTIFDMSGDIPRIAAEVNLNNLLRDDKEKIKIKSAYNVEVEPGYDQAFIFGLVAVLEQLRP
jgi:hypothetical protein